MKKGDFIALGAILVILAYLLIFTDHFILLTKTYRYPMGFIKFALLAPYGRLLAGRLFGSKKWTVGWILLPQSILWGFTGMWITAAFVVFSSGTSGLIESSAWWNVSGFGLAFTKSLWINLLGGYAFFMMFIHELAERGVAEVIDRIKKSDLRTPIHITVDRSWFRIVMISIPAFWIPAHTVTFMLPAEVQVLFAAILSVALGLIKGWINERKKGKLSKT